MYKLFVLIALSLVSVSAFAEIVGPPAEVPEPQTLALLAVGAVAALIAKRKK